MENLNTFFTNEEIIDIKKEEDFIKKAYLLVNRLFSDKKDKEGKPYIIHLNYVKDHVVTYEEKVVALLHDIIEDTFITTSDLIDLGFTPKIVNAVDLLTNKKIIADKKENYLNYINNIINSNNLLALRVKKADMEHNMDKKRLSNLPIELRERLENKYEEPYKLIKKYFEKEG